MSPRRSSPLLRAVLLPLLTGACSAHAPPPPEAPAPVRLALEGALTPGGAPVRLELEGGVLLAIGPAQPAAPAAARADLITLGAVDAHAHPEGLGSLLVELDLSGTTSYAEVLERVAERHGALPPGAWLTGRGWDQEDWADAPPGGWPRALDLDAVVGDRPVALRRVDGHAVWVSSAALPALPPQDPAGGRVLRGPDGAPLGVLIDHAMELVQPPRPDLEERVRRLHAADLRMSQAGLVGVHAMGVDDPWLGALEEADRRGLLRVQVHAYLMPGGEGAARLLREGPWSGRRLHVVGLKAFADGAMGSRGALLHADYADEPGNRGLALATTEALAELAVAALRVRAQLAVHAIGDAAVSRALDAFALARQAVPEAAQVPLRVEHTQVIRPADLPRFAALNVVASMQPTHATSDMAWAEARLGPERVRWSYAWASVLRSGAVLALGSDFPVEHVSPHLGLWAATTRQSPAGEPPGGWRPEEALTLEQALYGFTVAPWLALGQPAPALAPGRVELTVWDLEPRDAGTWLQAVGVVLDGQWLPTDR